MNIQEKAEIEDRESSLLELQNRLEKLKDDFDTEKISEKEFSHWTQIYRSRLAEVQKELDTLED